MTSPFQDASLADLLRMVQNGDLSNPELDALAAKYCEGYIQSWDNHRPSWLPPGKSGTGGACPKYTSDSREAMRLLVKYRLGVHQPVDDYGIQSEKWWAYTHGGQVSVHISPRRAITEAALTAALTAMMEKANGC